MLALDLETTGLNPRRDEIVGAGWVKVAGGRILLSSAQSRTIQPKRAMSPSSVVVHGISDDRAATGRHLDALLQELLPLLSGAVLVAHHAPMDAAFLSEACRRCYGASWAGPSIDTLELTERMFRRSQHPVVDGSLRLGAARRRYGLPDYPEHDALWDAISAAELWLAIAGDIRGNEALPLARVVRVLP
jgi:DNA polymerase-3 subunit epsilon